MEEKYAELEKRVKILEEIKIMSPFNIMLRGVMNV